MQRARRSMLSVLVLAFALVGIAGLSPIPLRTFGPAAAVGWPPSTGAVIAEVVTGGASASDEYVEIANAGATTLNLLDVELVYASAAGTTATRKTSWPASRTLAPGQHLLVANSAGVFAASADAVYSGGIAATGGAVALRVIGGNVIDAAGWGDATNALVEGTPAAAPPAGASVERRPGGVGGNATDTNENAADFLVQAHPVPQNLAAAFPGVPSASPSATGTPTPDPSVTSTPTSSPTNRPSETPSPTELPVESASPAPSQTPAPTEPTATEPPVSATSEPVPTDTPSPSLAPTDSPGPTPEPTDSAPPEPTPEPTLQPTPIATDPPVTPSPAESSAPPSATPALSSVAEARVQSDGVRVTVLAVLTTALGAFDGSRGAFVEDATAGIGLYLDAPVTSPLPRGTLVRVSGVLDARYSQRILRVARGDIEDLDDDVLPEAAGLSTDDATELFEGRRVILEGAMVGSASDVADGISFTIDDGSGPAKVIVSAMPAGLMNGVVAHVVGPLGQHDSSGTGTSGYRVYALEADDVVVVVAPASPDPSSSPSPSPLPTVTPQPSITASPSPSMSPSSSPSPSPSPSTSGVPLVSIAVARSAVSGTRVRVRGVVTAEVGRVGASLISIQDPTGGLALHLPPGAIAPGPGTVVDASGELAAPFGQVELRPEPVSWHTDGSDVVPPPVVLAGPLDESLEGLLVGIVGVVATTPTTGSSGDVTLDVDLASGARVRVQADASSGIGTDLLHRGSRYSLTGVVGQHASALGRLDGYRIWLRASDDVTQLPDPSPSPSPSPAGTLKPTASPRPTATAKPTATSRPTATPKPSGPAVITIAAAILKGGAVAVEGVVTAGSGLLDAGGRTVVVQDATAAIEVRLPSGKNLKVGRRVRLGGDSGRSLGAPRLLATTVTDLGAGVAPVPLRIKALPTAAAEWRLVQISGMVMSVRRSGKAWKADVAAGSQTFLVDVLAGAAIASDRLKVGGTATVTGIVRRPYPSASDRRFAVLPRSIADAKGTGGKATGADTSGPTPKPAKTATTGTSNSTTPVRNTRGVTATAAPSVVAPPLDVDLVDLPAAAGQTVRVGGLITATNSTGVILDDGTATAAATFSGDALAILPQLSVGLAVNLVGVAGRGTTPRVAVSHGDAIVPIADPAVVNPGSDPSPGTQASADATSTDGADATAAFGLSGAEQATGDPEPAADTGTVLVLVGLLLSLALVGVVALLLGRRPAIRAMAHPLAGSKR